MTKGSTKHETLGNYLGDLFVAFLLTVLCVVGIAPNQANGALRAVAGSTGGIVSGGAATLNPLTLGNVPSPDVLYVGPTGVVTGSANLTYVDTSPLLTVGSGTTTSAGVQIGYVSSGISTLTQTGVAFSSSNYHILMQPTALSLSGTNAGTAVRIRPNSGALGVEFGSNYLDSETDGAIAIGKSTNRFSSAFLGSSTAITASAPAANIFQIWNNAAASFSANVTNVTNTASAAGSLLQDWQMGGSTVVRILPTGQMLFGTSLSLTPGSPSTIQSLGSNGLQLGANNNTSGDNVSNLYMKSAALASWNGDTGLARNAAGVVEVNNGTAGTLASIVAANYVGTTTNNNAAAGSIGEYITSSVASSGAIVMNSGTPITTVSTGATVTAGDYDAQGTACYSTAIATSITVLEQGISTSNNTFSTLGSYTSDQFAAMVPLATGTNEICRSTPTVRISLSGTSTVFLVTRGVFTVSTLSSYGFLRLRRVR